MADAAAAAAAAAVAAAAASSSSRSKVAREGGTYCEGGTYSQLKFTLPSFINKSAPFLRSFIHQNKIYLFSLAVDVKSP